MNFLLSLDVPQQALLAVLALAICYPALLVIKAILIKIGQGIAWLANTALGIILLPFTLTYFVLVWVISAILTVITFGQYTRQRNRVKRIVEEELIRNEVRSRLN